MGSFRELVFKTGFKTLIKMIIVRCFSESSRRFHLIKHFTHQNPINSYSSPSSKIHNAWIGVTLLEKQMLEVLIDEVDFNWVHPLVDSFQDQMVPVWTEPQKLPKISHIIFQYCHYNSGLQHTVVTTKLYCSFWFLDQNRLLLLSYRQTQRCLASFIFWSDLLGWSLLLRCIQVFDLVQRLLLSRLIFFLSSTSFRLHFWKSLLDLPNRLRNFRRLRAISSKLALYLRLGNSSKRSCHLHGLWRLKNLLRTHKSILFVKNSLGHIGQ